VNASLGGRIAGGNNYPSVGQFVLAKLAIKDKLIAASLRHLGRGGQLVEKQDALPCGGKKLGRHPFRLVRRNAGQTAKVDGIELHSPHIEEGVVEIGGNLPDDLRFADAAWSPDMQGHTLTDKRMKRFIELGGFHGLSLKVEVEP
jgi:hypothetical protein